MNWVTALAVVAIITGATMTVVVLLALATLRRNIDDTVVRQAQQIKRLTEAVAALTLQQQQHQTRIQELTEASRRLSDRLGDRDESGRANGSARLLH
ncbi:MAG TPA: hypothetical protein VEB64_10065 [Azospirillaceae bacterium]|nr:hypothetical protein [Azospirillaceae bacterium]